MFKYTNVQKNTWTKFSVTSKVTKDSYKAGSLLLSISANGLIYVSKLKLEKGSKATDFTLAPEDVDSEIGTKANKTDVYVKSEVYTKSQTDSAINIAKDSINLGVSQTYETKSNVESKITTAVNNVQVGGRNLAQGTSNIYTTAYSSFSGGTNTCPSLAKVLTDGLVVGDTVIQLLSAIGAVEQTRKGTDDAAFRGPAAVLAKLLHQGEGFPVDDGGM